RLVAIVAADCAQHRRCVRRGVAAIVVRHPISVWDRRTFHRILRAGLRPNAERAATRSREGSSARMTRYVLGLSAHYHDSAAALVGDGEIVAAASEERFSRIKHDPSLPVHAATACLESQNIKAEDLEYIVFHEKPLLKFERLIVTQLRELPRSFRAFQRMGMAWLPYKLWIRNSIAKHFGVPTSKIIF